MLREVFGLLVVAHDAADVPVDVARVALVQKPQRIAIPALAASDRIAHLACCLRRLIKCGARTRTDVGSDLG